MVVVVVVIQAIGSQIGNVLEIQVLVFYCLVVSFFFLSVIKCLFSLIILDAKWLTMFLPAGRF